MLRKRAHHQFRGRCRILRTRRPATGTRNVLSDANDIEQRLIIMKLYATLAGSPGLVRHAARVTVARAKLDYEAFKAPDRATQAAGRVKNALDACSLAHYMSVSVERLVKIPGCRTPEGETNPT